MSDTTNERAETGRETWTSGEDNPSYALTDDGDGLTLRISGTAYRNLRRIADALNRVNARKGLYADADNSPLSVFWFFELDFIRFDSADEAREAAYLICDGIDATPDFVEDLRAEVRGIDFGG